MLVANAPPYGYVWDFYRDGVRVLWETGRLPVASDCWQCYHPPLFYVAGWPLYALGRWIDPLSDVWADRLLSGLSLAAVAVTIGYGYRLLRLFEYRGAALVAGLSILVASPLLFLSSYGAEADTLLTAIMVVFLFEITRAFGKGDEWGWATSVRIGLIAGAAAATKYSGLLALALAGVVMGIRLIREGDRRRVCVHGVVVLVTACAVGGWKYVDNVRVAGTPLLANGSASAGLTLDARDNRAGYEFTTIRLGELRALFGPRPAPGELTTFPVYASVLTTLHAQMWSDMSFFSVPSRHGHPTTPYVRRVLPVWLVMTVIVLGFVPAALACLGLIVTIGRPMFWPVGAFGLLAVGAYVLWFLPQVSWALKAKYLAFLVPVMALYAVAALDWCGRRAPAVSWVAAALLAGLFVSASVYQLGFALGHL